ncbi:unnamed protein product [Brachionus calyciflorus]|uniref:cysteine--tRNA ligase n=1 Tax=Brachionus calyciflorus TaxID=104777 RepID=A0A813M9Z4_9BILA|nr:unnamed protein product [Brachionus calyciflorus]
MVLRSYSELKFVTFFKNASRNYFTNSKPQINVFNSLTKTKEPLILKNNILYWYSCGPTVYNSAHIGHASSYVNFDIIKRILTNYFQINVVNLMNITDIDDKIIIRSIQEKKNFLEITKFYENEFLEDLQLLNCKKPDLVLRVTDHVPEIVKFIQRLIDTKKAYVTQSGSVYFNTQVFKIKSFFEQIETENQVHSKDNKEKHHPFDFALWKSKKDPLEPSWESPWGLGRPGWHIECSTLANIAFGRDIDFHSGGKDLVFPHHHNEMVQCCAFHKMDKWSSFWLHTGHLHLKNDVKMSKSLQNTISIREMLDKHSANHFRMFCLLSPYRNDKEYSDEKMVKAANLTNKFSTFLSTCENFANETLKSVKFTAEESEVFQRLDLAKEKISKALADDFNTCLVIDELSEIVNFMNKNFVSKTDIVEVQDLNRHFGCVMGIHNYIKSILELFGMSFNQNSSESCGLKIEPIVDISLKFRSSIRNLALDKTNKLPKEIKMEILKYCDEFRENLNKSKIEFKDHKTETIWKIKH